MKVLILSITAGGGHNATAKSIQEYFASMNVESVVFDTYQCINNAIASAIDKGYLISTKNISKIYSRIYTAWENRKFDEQNPGKNTSMLRLFQRLLAKRLEKRIISYKPDAIVCTHILSGIFMDIFKISNKITVPVYNVLTDFVFHPFWEEGRHLDYIITANELLNLQGIKKGYKISQILPFGIPIHPKFAKSENKPKARKSLGLHPNKFTILIMGGSMGYGDIENTVSKIDKITLDFQIIVICGNNEKIKREIESNEYNKEVQCYGFVNNVDECMDAADCIVTKPGGLTTSEAFAKHLPIIIVNPIPGQEERNTEFLLNNGVAMAVTKTTPIDEVLFQFFYYPEKIENMKKNISILRRPNATKDICEFIAEEYNKH